MIRIVFAVLFSLFIINRVFAEVPKNSADKNAANIIVDAEGQTKTYAVGDIFVTAIKDTDTNMGKSILLNPDSQIVRKIMQEDASPSTINTFLIKTSEHNILIDTGIGGNGGKTIENLEALGINPEDIDIILITHTHNDHIGGLVFDGQKAFPNAKVYISKLELDFCLSKQLAAAAHKAVEIYSKDLIPFEFDESNSTTLFKEDVFQIKALKAIGHTPGHTIYKIISGRDEMLIIGDLVHNIKVQTADPSMSVIYDDDPTGAALTREEVFSYAQKNDIKIAGMHIPFPGVGRLSIEKDKEYVFIPIP
jgi:glyoxylase-like metal-dependent hydrolase (beta-lactamase superfamily II)